MDADTADDLEPEPGLLGGGPWPLDWHVAPGDVDLDDDPLLHHPYIGIDNDVDIRAALDAEQQADLRELVADGGTDG